MGKAWRMNIFICIVDFYFYIKYILYLYIVDQIFPFYFSSHQRILKKAVQPVINIYDKK